MARDYRSTNTIIDTDSSSGGVTTIPGDMFVPGPNMSECYIHKDKKAVVVIQGETDSFGCEYVAYCQECEDNFTNGEVPDNICDSCGAMTQTTPSRDPEEGMSGPIYEYCSLCRELMKNNFLEPEGLSDDDF